MTRRALLAQLAASHGFEVVNLDTVPEEPVTPLARDASVLEQIRHVLGEDSALGSVIIGTNRGPRPISKVLVAPWRATARSAATTGAPVRRTEPEEPQEPTPAADPEALEVREDVEPIVERQITADVNLPPAPIFPPGDEGGQEGVPWPHPGRAVLVAAPGPLDPVGATPPADAVPSAPPVFRNFGPVSPNQQTPSESTQPTMHRRP